MFFQKSGTIFSQNGRSMAWFGIGYGLGGISMRMEQPQERELRRVMKKAGYTLRKSAKAISPDNLGGYMIVSLANNAVAVGSRYELSLEDIQSWVDDMC